MAPTVSIRVLYSWSLYAYRGACCDQLYAYAYVVPLLYSPEYCTNNCNPVVSKGGINTQRTVCMALFCPGPSRIVQVSFIVKSSWFRQ